MMNICNLHALGAERKNSQNFPVDGIVPHLLYTSFSPEAGKAPVFFFCFFCKIKRECFCSALILCSMCHKHVGKFNLSFNGVPILRN